VVCDYLEKCEKDKKLLKEFEIDIRKRKDEFFVYENEDEKNL
jgi:hypothetical protein